MDNTSYGEQFGTENEVLCTDCGAVRLELSQNPFSSSSLTSLNAGTYSKEWLTTSYIQNLFKAISDTSSFWTTAVSISDEYHQLIDETEKPPIVKRSTTTTGSSSSSTQSSSPTTTVTETITITEITNDDLGTVSDGILQIATDKNTNVDSVLEKNDLMEDIKKSLLALSLSEDLTAKITDMNNEDLIEFLKGLYNGTNADMIQLDESIIKYLEQLQENGTLKDLLSNSENSELLKNGITEFKGVSQYLKALGNKGVEEIKINLLYTDNGYVPEQNLSENGINIIRGFNESMAQDKNMSTEQLLTSTEHNDYILNRFNEFKNTSSYLATLSDCDSKNVQKSLQAILM